MNHDKATEEFFRLRGWKQIQFKVGGRLFWDQALLGEDLPKICESMTDWIKYVAEFMEGEGLKFDPNMCGAGWISLKELQNDFPEKEYFKFYEDHQILYASVLAANEYLKGRKNDKS